MTKEEKLTKVTEAIQKACPDLLELKFGCVVVHYFDHYDGSHAENSIVISKNEDEILVLTKAQGIVISKEYIEEDFEILGQPIRIASVLRAIKKLNKDLTIDGMETHSQNITVDSYGLFGAAYSMSLDVYWNLEKDTLDQQEKPVISLLYSIFYP